jgi:hypothetical protein
LQKELSLHLALAFSDDPRLLLISLFDLVVLVGLVGLVESFTSVGFFHSAAPAFLGRAVAVRAGCCRRAIIHVEKDLMTTRDADIEGRLARIETLLTTLVSGRSSQEFYGTDRVAEILGKAPFTIREWARTGRIRAEKRDCGRGRSKEWLISHDELERYLSHGLRPFPVRGAAESARPARTRKAAPAAAAK